MENCNLQFLVYLYYDVLQLYGFTPLLIYSLGIGSDLSPLSDKLRKCVLNDTHVLVRLIWSY